MTALPDDATKTHLDQATDDPKQARLELVSVVDKFNAMRGFLSGLLGATGIPADARSALGLGALSTKTQAATADIANKSVTKGKMADGTPGGILSYQKTTGEIVEIPPGDTGQVLQCNGADELPTWVDKESGLKVYESSWFDMSTGGERIISHPSFFTTYDSQTVKIELKCDDGTPITVDGEGQVIIPSVTDLEYEYGEGVKLDVTNGYGSGREFQVRYTTNFETKIYLPVITPAIRRRDTASVGTITLSKWKYKVLIIGS